jgi:hypothetical protein
VKRGGAAEAVGGGRIVAGLSVVGVGGACTEHMEPRAVMALIKAAGRPLSLVLSPVIYGDEDDEKEGLGGAVEGGRLRVLSDVPLVHSHLRHRRYRVLPLRKWDGSTAQLTAERADILFVGQHVPNFVSLPPGLRVNQFVNESCVTSKARMFETVMRHCQCASGAGVATRPPPPSWLPEQYVLPQQRVGLREAWEERLARGADNSCAPGVSILESVHVD